MDTSAVKRIKTTLFSGRPLLERKRYFLYIGIILLLLAAAVPVFTRGTFTLDEQTLSQAEKEYGPGARKRLEAWVKLIREDQSTTDMEKLEKVNSFFNQLQFVDDIIHWKQKDYWATPIELLASDGGDCEDFSIGKYFTLKIMGVSEEKLNMTYVKALKLNQAHMVITYYEKPGAEPLVLDNLNKLIKPASQRNDLLPVYSFNGTSLWIAKQRGKGKMVGSSERLGQWKNLLERMPNGLI
ncbi:MAG: transglutaminase-like cysteine peptidase [Desulfobulbaceae bacterium]|nr:transglutaminase-like cysteine peptidase [Desulfobulbaceae bacterium]